MPAYMAACGFLVIPPRPVYEPVEDDSHPGERPPAQAGPEAWESDRRTRPLDPGASPAAIPGWPFPPLGPFSGHPERLRPDQPPSPAEAAIWSHIWDD